MSRSASRRQQGVWLVINSDRPARPPSGQDATLGNVGDGGLTCAACRSPARISVLYKGGMTAVWSSQPVESCGDEWALVDVYDPEVDLLDLDDLYASGD